MSIYRILNEIVLVFLVGLKNFLIEFCVALRYFVLHLITNYVHQLFLLSYL